ncbi:hypothetical protein [Propioniciclava soli]|uniref:hypothetical protein n=1 Tax=Propioniciclava soli TaxID=2775081 RepID=UPI001E2C57EB|nr:hypothetical protein [Propioniciclava soli]
MLTQVALDQRQGGADVDQLLNVGDTMARELVPAHAMTLRVQGVGQCKPLNRGTNRTHIRSR